MILISSRTFSGLLALQHPPKSLEEEQKQHLNGQPPTRYHGCVSNSIGMVSVHREYVPPFYCFSKLFYGIFPRPSQPRQHIRTLLALHRKEAQVWSSQKD